MAILIVQAVQAFGAFSGAFGAGVTANNSVTLQASAYNASNQAISSSSPEYNGSTPAGSSSLEGLSSAISGGDSVYCAIWLMPDVAGGGTSVSLTVTNGENVSSTGLIAQEVSGLGASPSLDQSSSDSGNSTNPTSGATGNITASPELVLAAAVQFAVAVTPPGGGWTNYQAGGDYSAFGSQVVTSSGGSYSYATTSPGAAVWCAVIATVKGTSAASVAPPNRLCGQAVNRASTY